MKCNTNQLHPTSIRKKIQIIILILRWGIFRKSDNFPDSNNFRAKTFQIEQVSCKIVKAATRVRKTTLSIPIPMEERISITFWQNIFCKVKHFHVLSGQHPDQRTLCILDTCQIIRILCTSSRHSSYPLDTFWNIWTFFRSPGSSRYFSYHPDTFRIIWTPCRPSVDL